MSFSPFTSILALAMTVTVASAQTRMVQLDEVSQEVTLRNFSTTDTVDTSGFFMCIAPSTYRQVSGLPIVQGDLMLSPGEEVTIVYSFVPAAGGVGLYANDNGFGNSNNMLDYVQYGGVAGFRQGTAISAGLWVGGTFASGSSGPFAYSGDGVNDNGAGFWAAEFGTNYCGPAVVNSSGASATLSGAGSTSVSVNDLTLTASGLPANQFSFIINSQTQGFVVGPGGSQGNICLSGSVGRFNNQLMNSGPGGSYSIVVDLTAIPQPTGAVAVMAGETYNFQAWFRDNNPASTSNFTDGLSITFN